MANRPQPNLSKIMTGDGEVKNRPGIVYSVHLSWAGATDGDIVALRDGGAEGEVKLRLNVESTNGSREYTLGKYGVRFTTDIVYAETVAAANTVWTTVFYD